ncbi:hypothetical protein V2O64_18550 [Verrucomicrobiaceae bacterium 227]
MMKPSLLLTILFMSPLAGQEQKPNRFKKPTPESELLETFVRTLTHMEVSKKLLRSWQEQHPGKTISRDQAHNWQQSGEASLINEALMVGLVTLKENYEHQQGIIRELITPDSLLPQKNQNEWPMPAGFSSWDLGTSWDISFTSSQEGEITDRLNARYRAHLGSHFNDPILEKSSKPGDIWTPIFLSSRQEGKLLFRDDNSRPIEIDSSCHPEMAILVFTEVQKIKLPALKMTRRPDNNSLTVSAFYIKVPHSDWKAFSNERQMSDLIGQSATWAANLVSQKRASILHSPSVKLSFKHYGIIEEIDEVIYPTEYVGSDLPGPQSLINAPTPAAFDTKNIGVSLELYPDLHPSGYLLMRYSSYLGSYHGKTPVHRFFDGQEWIADAWMPRFSHINQKGIVALTPGENTLVGVSSAIDSQGNPDPANRLLFFLKAE